MLSGAAELRSRGGYIIGVGSTGDGVFDDFIRVPDAGIASVNRRGGPRSASRLFRRARARKRSRSAAKPGQKRYGEVTEAPAPPPIVDTHTHLDDPAFDLDRETVIETSRAAGVRHFVNIGYAPDRWESSRALRERHPDVDFALGLHPQLAEQYERLVASRPEASDRGSDSRCRRRNGVRFFEISTQFRGTGTGISRTTRDRRRPRPSDYHPSARCLGCAHVGARSLAGTWHRSCFTRSTAHSASRTGQENAAASSE